MCTGRRVPSAPSSSRCPQRGVGRRRCSTVEEVRNDADLARDAEGRTVSRARLSDTAVTPCDCSIENATTDEYDGSLPTSVMSVPCSVVTFAGWSEPRCRHQHLIGEVGGRRVRHGVVRVHDVEARVRATRTIVLASASRYCGSGTAGTAAP
jgi:hypothetical protein